MSWKTVAQLGQNLCQLTDKITWSPCKIWSLFGCCDQCQWTCKPNWLRPSWWQLGQDVYCRHHAMHIAKCYDCWSQHSREMDCYHVHPTRHSESEIISASRSMSRTSLFLNMFAFFCINKQTPSLFFRRKSIPTCANNEAGPKKQFLVAALRYSNSMCELRPHAWPHDGHRSKAPF